MVDVLEKPIGEIQNEEFYEKNISPDGYSLLDEIDTPIPDEDKHPAFDDEDPPEGQKVILKVKPYTLPKALEGKVNPCTLPKKALEGKKVNPYTLPKAFEGKSLIHVSAALQIKNPLDPSVVKQGPTVPENKGLNGSAYDATKNQSTPS